MLREISTQRYGKQRVTKKLSELKDALDNEEFLFRGMTMLITKEKDTSTSGRCANALAYVAPVSN